MFFRGRTVIMIVTLSMMIGSVFTFTVVNMNTTGFTNVELKKISSVIGMIEEEHYNQVDKTKMLDAAIRGMVDWLEDPYTVYYDAEHMKQMDELNYRFSSGIGTEIAMEENRVTVISPVKNSPSEQAGIQARDQIISVNGESLEGLSLKEAVLKLRGPKGTHANLEIIRPGVTEPLKITVVRNNLEVETVHLEMLEGNIGKMKIDQFSQYTAQHFHEGLRELEDEGMQSLIIDVRSNPGGLLNSVVDVLNPLLENGKLIVQVEDKEGNRKQFFSDGNGKPYPIVVLTNHGSASASEILAGAIKDSADGIIVGENTFGKGTVQKTFLTAGEDGSQLKITTERWLTPAGRVIHEKGIEPDILVEQPLFFATNSLESNHSDLQLQKAVEILKQS
ncbi:S41 family peptidase [Chengkuizengella axinellae]|uniref:S41 family peptidase n=1 Tax=Chengkuizengella axinellae TaxID=3064388 RepID=A0ABT9J2S0_9BACL|nr:S41 family peptidase [Chengkuizengella sp. 2205SS18-9]MDP5275917.1 S41 family peptidase [Chengkuizengella sp. 2205SS18-9]